MEATLDDKLMRCAVVFAFGLLFGVALFLFLNIYICDGDSCTAFRTADSIYEKDSQENVLLVLGDIYGDGVWSAPFLSSFVAVCLAIWLLGLPITVKNFTIMFLVVFFVTYFMFSFLGHHYVKPMKQYVARYIEKEDFCEADVPDTNANTSSDEI